MYLIKVLEGFLYQKEAPCEIIIADDGSGRDTEDLIRKLAAQFSFPLLHVWQENKGFRAGKIRNSGIVRASGDYIILLDGDCVVDRNFISDHLSLAEAGCFVQGKRILVGKNAVEYFDCHKANSFPALWKMAMTGRISNSHHIMRLPFAMSIRDRRLKGIKSCNMGFYKQDVLAVNGFNEDYIGWGNEDSDLACRFYKYGLIKKTSPLRAICFHLWHPTNKASGDLNKKLLDKTISSDTYFCDNGIFKKP